ncbi:MAG: Na/H antiporter [Ignavibacteria bacterium]|nr:MAG: Na/H antiporter [Ignavibacteria bacterium]KAF0161057.1 MAG: Na/H antiporter [Ignavibacteria bacterium]
MSLSEHDIVIFLSSVAVMLFFSRVIGEFLKKFKQPIVLGEILAGIILGPTIIGALFPEVMQVFLTNNSAVNIAFQGITLLAVVMLLLVSGLEVDLSLVARQGKAASLISFMGFVFPFGVGFGAAWFFPDELGISANQNNLIFALFVGTALSITALPVVARTLMDLNIFKTEIGFVIIASAMLNDLVGWIIFSLILAMINGGTNGLEFSSSIFMLSAFIVFILFIGRKIFNYILPKFERVTTYPGGILNLILVLGFAGAAFSEWLGVHAIFGAFIVGIAIGDSVHLKEETREIIQQFVTNIFAPLFFVSIGLRVNFIQHFDLGIVLLFLILAFVGKVIGCGLGAYWGGMSKEDSLTVGFGMNSRGAMEIVLGTLAFQAGLIQEKVFVALVIMALVTSLTSAPAMAYFLKRSKKKMNFKDLLRNDLIIFSDAQNKQQLITELSGLIDVKHKINKEKIEQAVWKREQQLSTGLANGLAIPHARLKIQAPLVAVGICKNEIDFNSLDGSPAKVVVMLLTPETEHELQLKLLADISKCFQTKSFLQELSLLSSPNDVISKINLLS